MGSLKSHFSQYEASVKTKKPCSYNLDPNNRVIPTVFCARNRLPQQLYFIVCCSQTFKICMSNGNFLFWTQWVVTTYMYHSHSLKHNTIKMKTGWNDLIKRVKQLIAKGRAMLQRHRIFWWKSFIFCFQTEMILPENHTVLWLLMVLITLVSHDHMPAACLGSSVYHTQRVQVRGIAY